MKITELKSLSKQELEKILSEKREELRLFRFKIAKGNVKNVKQARELKKDAARVLTVLKNTN